MDTETPAQQHCANCGSSDLRIALVRTAFWHDDRLIVIEDVPALLCGECQEQFYDDNTAIVLDLLRGEGFPPEKARGELRVPVFSFSDRLPSGDRS